MYIASLQTLRVNWDDCASPAAPNWQDVSFPTTSTITLDPILFTDFGAGRFSPSRTFVSQLGPKTSFLAYSDDNGESYLQSQGSGINSGVDHQTVGGGPYSKNSEPLHPLYPNAMRNTHRRISPSPSLGAVMMAARLSDLPCRCTT